MTLDEAVAKIRREIAKERRRAKSPFTDAWAGGASYVLTRLRELVDDVSLDLQERYDDLKESYDAFKIHAEDRAYEDFQRGKDDGYVAGYEAGRSDRDNFGGCGD